MVCWCGLTVTSSRSSAEALQSIINTAFKKKTATSTFTRRHLTSHCLPSGRPSRSKKTRAKRMSNSPYPRAFSTLNSFKAHAGSVLEMDKCGMTDVCVKCVSDVLHGSFLRLWISLCRQSYVSDSTEIHRKIPVKGILNLD